MSDHPNSINYIALSVFKLISGTITDDEFAKFQEVLIRDEVARKHYYELMYVSVALKNTEGIQCLEETFIFDMDLWREMAEHENTSSRIEIPQQKPQHELIRKVVYPQNKRKVSKFSIGFLIMNAAAILFLFLFLQFAPPKAGIEVAMLTDSINAKWIGVKEGISHGTPMTTGNESLFLHEGYAEILFHNQAKITIEGPAEFRILTDDQIKLNYGRLYAVVPSEAIGFTIKTPSTQIIDLGTEFGVQADFQGDTSLHVMKGRTVLIASDKSNKVSIEVNQGDAKRVSGHNQAISDISYNDHMFAREIDSTNKLIWRGQTKISLADIVAGSNGFGKIHSFIGLDPGTGQYILSLDSQARRSEKDYIRISDSPFIDGVFVPDGGPDGTIVVTSANDTFQCPDTSGEYTYGIAVCSGDINRQQNSIPQAVFGGYRYVNNEIVMIHSNAGVTFDLQAIRQSLPGLRLGHFKAFGGLSETIIPTNQPPNVDFWVLIDGQIRYEKTGLNHLEGEVSFDIELSHEDRFLTLIVTDGSGSQGYSDWGNDFFYLIDPQLHIAESLDSP